MVSVFQKPIMPKETFDLIRESQLIGFCGFCKQVSISLSWQQFCSCYFANIRAPEILFWYQPFFSPWLKLTGASLNQIHQQIFKLNKPQLVYDLMVVVTVGSTCVCCGSGSEYFRPSLGEFSKHWNHHRMGVVTYKCICCAVMPKHMSSCNAKAYVVLWFNHM